MNLEYKNEKDEEFTKKLFNILQTCHDPKIAKIRDKLFNAEFKYFRNNIQDKMVLDVGCGLGHEAFELAKHNLHVTAFDINTTFVDYAKEQTEKESIHNIDFMVKDLFNNSFDNKSFDCSIFNMGTICDFNNSKYIIKEFMRISNELFFDFYPPTKHAFDKRIIMYSQEKFANVRQQGKAIISDGPIELYSGSYTRKEINNIVKGLEYKVDFTQLTDFAIMARVY